MKNRLPDDYSDSLLKSVSPARAALDAIRLNLEDKAGSIEWLRVHSQGMLTPTTTQPPRKANYWFKGIYVLTNTAGEEKLFYHKCECTFTQLDHILHLMLEITYRQITMHRKFK